MNRKAECYQIGTEWIPVHEVQVLQSVYRTMIDAQVYLTKHGIMTNDEIGKALAQMVNFFRKGDHTVGNA